ncbi:MAG: ORF2 protein [Hibiscus virus X]
MPPVDLLLLLCIPLAIYTLYLLLQPERACVLTITGESLTLTNCDLSPELLKALPTQPLTNPNFQ